MPPVGQKRTVENGPAIAFNALTPPIDDAVPVAKALVAGGVKVLEVTLRTECAIEAIRRIAKEVPEAIVGDP